MIELLIDKADTLLRVHHVDIKQEQNENPNDNPQDIAIEDVEGNDAAKIGGIDTLNYHGPTAEIWA